MTTVRPSPFLMSVFIAAATVLVAAAASPIMQLAASVAA